VTGVTLVFPPFAGSAVQPAVGESRPSAGAAPATDSFDALQPILEPGHEVIVWDETDGAYSHR
jgi:hypothetical protein